MLNISQEYYNTLIAFITLFGGLNAVWIDFLLGEDMVRYFQRKRWRKAARQQGRCRNISESTLFIRDNWLILKMDE